MIYSLDSAFPKPIGSSAGLNKRELIAAMLLQGLLSSGPDMYDAKYNQAARVAVAHADALIEQLNKPTNEEK